MSKPSLQSPAPDFTAPVVGGDYKAGDEVTLSKLKGRPVVLYFYPKDDTPGCTKQACAFRDNIKKITSQGADVFGISTDTVKDQAVFHAEGGIADPGSGGIP